MNTLLRTRFINIIYPYLKTTRNFVEERLVKPTILESILSATTLSGSAPHLTRYSGSRMWVRGLDTEIRLFLSNRQHTNRAICDQLRAGHMTIGASRYGEWARVLQHSRIQLLALEQSGCTFCQGVRLSGESCHIVTSYMQCLFLELTNSKSGFPDFRKKVKLEFFYCLEFLF